MVRPSLRLNFLLDLEFEVTFPYVGRCVLLMAMLSCVMTVLVISSTGHLSVTYLSSEFQSFDPLKPSADCM
jgi:hypothetical protein